MKDLGIKISDVDYGLLAQQPVSENGVTLGDLLAAVRRQFLPLVLCTLLGLVAGAAHYLTSPPQYYAAATVLVDDRMSELAEEITANLPMIRNDTALLNEIQVLKSLQLATEVTRNTRLYENTAYLIRPSSKLSQIIASSTAAIKQALPASSAQNSDPGDVLTPDQMLERRIENVASSLQHRIEIDRVERSFSVNIGITMHEPKLAAELVNAYADAYLADHLNANLEATKPTAAWMRDRLDEIQENANAASLEAAKFRAENRVSDVQGLRELEQRVETLNNLHQAISQRYEQIVIEGSFPVTSGRILSNAITPKNPMSPKLWQTLAIMGILGLIIGFSIAVLRELREKSFRTGEDIRDDTGATFLGYLPHFKARRLRKIAPPPPEKPAPAATAQFISSRPSKTAAPGALLQSALHGGPAQIRHQDIKSAPHLFLPVLDPGSPYNETLRNIHATFDLNTPGSSGGVIAVTSVLPGEGSSTLAANYANMIAKFGARTLLIDANLRSPMLSADLGCNKGPGIVQVLEGTLPLPDAVCRLPYTGLNFLPCTGEPNQIDASDVFYQKRAAEVFASIRKQYDYVVLDMPALGQTANAKALLASIDKIVLVCEWGATPRKLVSQFLTHEPEISKKVLGITLNKVNLRKLSRYGARRVRDRQYQDYARI